jgi:uncharacterized membrane protein YczE
MAVETGAIARTQRRDPAVNRRAAGIGCAALRWLQLLVGLAAFASGLTLMLHADLGLSSWDVLHDAVAGVTPLTFGQAVVGISIAVVLGSLALRVVPGPGTIANVVLIGLMTDWLIRTRILEIVPHVLLVRALESTVGIAAIAFGTALYIGAGLGAGPRDSLMLGVARKLRVSAGTARAAIEVSVLLGGAALGGTVGVGTVIFAIVIGPAIDVSFRFLRVPTPHEDGP